MSLFGFYIIRSTQQRRELSYVMWYEETRAEQTLLRFFSKDMWL